MSDTVLIGKKTKKVVIPKEEVVNVPKLSWVFERLDGTDLTNLFPDELLFISYIKELVTKRHENNISDFFDTLLRIAMDEGNLSDSEFSVLEDLDVKLYVTALIDNFQAFV